MFKKLRVVRDSGFVESQWAESLPVLPGQDRGWPAPEPSWRFSPLSPSCCYIFTENWILQSWSLRTTAAPGRASSCHPDQPHLGLLFIQSVGWGVWAFTQPAARRDPRNHRHCGLRWAFEIPFVIPPLTLWRGGRDPERGSCCCEAPQRPSDSLGALQKKVFQGPA